MRSAFDLRELILDQRLLLGEAFGRGAAAAGGGGELGAQIAFGLLAGGDLLAQLRAFELAIGEDAHLVGQPALQLLHAPAENLGLGGLRHQRALELHHAVAELLDLAALFVELGGGGGRGLALAFQAVADLLGVAFVAVDAVLQRLDLGAQRHQLRRAGCRR